MPLRWRRAAASGWGRRFRRHCRFKVHRGWGQIITGYGLGRLPDLHGGAAGGHVHAHPLRPRLLRRVPPRAARARRRGDGARRPAALPPCRPAAWSSCEQRLFTPLAASRRARSAASLSAPTPSSRSASFPPLPTRRGRWRSLSGKARRRPRLPPARNRPRRRDASSRVEIQPRCSRDIAETRPREWRRRGRRGRHAPPPSHTPFARRLLGDPREDLPVFEAARASSTLLSGRPL